MMVSLRIVHEKLMTNFSPTSLELCGPYQFSDLDVTSDECSFLSEFVSLMLLFIYFFSFLFFFPGLYPWNIEVPRLGEPPHAKCNTFSFNCSLQNSLQEFPLEPSQDSEATLLNRCLTLLGKKLSLPFLCEFLKYCLYVLIANNRFKVKVLVY